jgi:putative restriction endonuclease
MALEHLKDQSAVLAAVGEFDRLGRSAFLDKYGFGGARGYFLEIDGKRYDSKAIAGAAHGYQFPSLGPLRARDFSGGAATVQRILERMGFHMARPNAENGSVTTESNGRVSNLLEIGGIYTREELKLILPTQDSTLNTGIFQPAGFDSVLLFVTKDKPSDRTQYVDELVGDVLHWQGQTQGRKDALIVQHRERNLELLLFYRNKKYEYPLAGFKFEGIFEYVSHVGALPASFVLQRVAAVSARAEADAEYEAEAFVQASGAFDPTSIEDARRKTFAAIVVRQGQPAFRKALLDAYEGRCALTDCDVEEVLEAAHITRYLGEESNHVRNGLLLRGDIHTLYDRAMIAIDPETYEVRIARDLAFSEYAALEGRRLRMPKNVASKPFEAAIQHHFMFVRKLWDEWEKAAKEHSRAVRKQTKDGSLA